MDTDQVQKLYTDNLSLYNRFIGVFQYRDGAKAVFRRMPQFHAGMRVLDAGCGTGAMTRALYELGRERNWEGTTFHGFDLTEATLEHFQAWASAAGVRNIQWRQADVLKPEQLPAEWTGYDLIISSGMLEYLPKDKLRNALAHLRSRLAPEGRAVILVSCRNVLMKWLLERWWHANLYTRDELQEALSQAGFTEVIFKAFPWAYGHLNFWGHVVVARALPQ